MRLITSKCVAILWLLLATLLACGPEDIKPYVGKKASAISGFYAGFDTSIYPGDNIMQDIWNNTNLYFVGFYLAPTNSRHRTNTSWMNKHDVLKAQGWGLVPFYFGLQQAAADYPSDINSMNSTTGQRDGMDAVTLMKRANFAAGSAVYLDVESNFTRDQRMLDYYQAWVQAVIDGGYTPGVYCSHLNIADMLYGYDSRPLFWAISTLQNHPRCKDYDDLDFPAWDPANSGVSYATGWQLETDCTNLIHGHSIHVDFDSSSLQDPSLEPSVAPPPPPPPSIPSTPSLIFPISVPAFPPSMTVNSSRIPLSWTTVTEANYYKIAFLIWFNSSWTQVGNWQINGNPVNVTGVPPSTYCAWGVQACNTSGCSPWSEVGYFITAS